MEKVQKKFIEKEKEKKDNEPENHEDIQNEVESLSDNSMKDPVGIEPEDTSADLNNWNLQISNTQIQKLNTSLNESLLVPIKTPVI